MTDPMEELRQASAEVSGVPVLSFAAQAVWDAAWQHSPINCENVADRRRQQIAAALRAAADQVVPEQPHGDTFEYCCDYTLSRTKDAIKHQLLAIAKELQDL